MSKNKQDFGLNMIEPELGDFALPEVGQPPYAVQRPTPQQQRAISAQGESAGFISRSHGPTVRSSKRRSIEGIPTKPLYIRCEQNDFDRFDRLAGAANLGRADFLVLLMDVWEREKR